MHISEALSQSSGGGRLNETLYAFLRSMDPDVRVKNPGVVGDYERVVETKTARSGRQYRVARFRHIRGGSYGETYEMSCPFCPDSKQRFWVSHVFGRIDAEFKTRQMAGLKCFRSECEKEFSNVQTLLERFELFEEGVSSSTIITESEFGDGLVTDLSQNRDLGRPGRCHDLRDLGPSHPAYQFLQYRGLNVERIAEQYGAMWISDGYRLSLMTGRLFIPFYRSERLLGYTCRHIPGLSEEADRKYLNSSGSLSGYCYGLNGASRSPVLVLVEGALDKWAVGDAAVAVMNKTLGYEKQQRIKPLVESGSLELIVVLVDPLQNPKDVEKGLPHPMNVMVESAESLGFVPVLPVWLPTWSDPGALHGEYLAFYLENYLARRGYERLGKILAGNVRRTSAAA